MNYIVKLLVLREKDGYAYSISIETEYGAVIDMWGDFIKSIIDDKVYHKITGELLKKLGKIVHEDSQVILYSDKGEFIEYINNVFTDIIDKETNFKVSFKAYITKFEHNDRVYSLALKVLKLKSRYPPYFE